MALYPDWYDRQLVKARLDQITSHKAAKAWPWQQVVLDTLKEFDCVLVTAPRRHGKTFLAARIANSTSEMAPVVLDDPMDWWPDLTDDERLEHIKKIMAWSWPRGFSGGHKKPPRVILMTPRKDEISKGIMRLARHFHWVTVTFMSRTGVTGRADVDASGPVTRAERESMMIPIKKPYPELGTSRLVTRGDAMEVDDPPRKARTDDDGERKHRADDGGERKRRSDPEADAPPPKRRKKKKRRSESKAKTATPAADPTPVKSKSKSPAPDPVPAKSATKSPTPDPETRKPKTPPPKVKTPTPASVATPKAADAGAADDMAAADPVPIETPVRVDADTSSSEESD